MKTRSALHATHLLQTPDTFVRTPMPGLTGGLAIIHAAPALGANFLQYTAELDTDATLTGSAYQRFVYVLTGEATLTLDKENYSEGAPHPHALRTGSFVYLPTATPATLRADSAARLAIIEKRYEPLHAVEPPQSLFGHRDDVSAAPLNGDPALLVKALLPADFAFDFAVNLMTYAPDAALSQVEIHVMEHGLLMLSGAGPYLLGDRQYDVAAGDFIWMAPFCPQWFRAAPDAPAEYLIYKDFNRRPAL